MLKIRNCQINLDLPNLGEIFFCLGGFFLVSALPLSGIFFLISIIISSFKIYPRDNYKYLLFICSGLMIFSTLSFIFISDMEIIYKETILLDLFNWIPLFLLFIYSKPFLLFSYQRILFIKCIIAGAFPLILSCILQYWFKLYGPYETLNGLIVWFQKPIEENHGGITGLFNNQNYTGLWLTAIIPFLIAELQLSKNKKIIISIFLLFNVFLVFLTTSKNALIGLIIAFLTVTEERFKKIFIAFAIGGGCFVLLNYLNINKFNFFKIKADFLPLATLRDLANFNFFDSSRFEIYKESIKLISERPLMGLGKSIFSELIFNSRSTLNIEHTHSLPLEIALNYGIPTASILIFFVFILLYRSWRKNEKFVLNKKFKIYNRAWISSGLVITLSHIFDITYYDGKVSILIWIILSGLRCIILESSTEYKLNIS